MTPLFPRVQEVENIFHKILASKEACARLRETFKFKSRRLSRDQKN